MQYRSFTGTLSAALLLLAVGVRQLKPFATATAQNKKAAPVDAALNCAVIDPLDRCVQQRFRQADKFFGWARMRPPTSHINHFVPNTPAESAAVTELEQAGWQVGFYLAGRRLLGPPPDLTKLAPPLRQQHPIINGPIAITRALHQQPERSENFGFPDPAELWEQAQRATRAFDWLQQYDFSVGKWQVAARPVRAAASCLQCHNNTYFDSAGPIYHPPNSIPIKVGDTLGIVLYAYRRAQ